MLPLPLPLCLDLLTGTRLQWKSGDIFIYAGSILATISLGSVFLVWPAMSEQLEVQLLALPLLLVSFRWWENYANTNEAIGEFNVKEIPEETLISLVDRI